MIFLLSSLKPQTLESLEWSADFKPLQTQVYFLIVIVLEIIICPVF